MSIEKTEEEITAEEVINILKAFFEEDKHILLTAPPGHGKTWVINKIYDIFRFQKLFDKARKIVLEMKEKIDRGYFDINEVDDYGIDIIIRRLFSLYDNILNSVSGNHFSLHDYIVDYLERYMLSNEISNQFNNGVIKIAPTGVAANNIQGMTYHSFFALNIFVRGQKAQISNADSRIIRYLRNMNDYGIAELLYRIPEGHEKIITNNENLFRVIHKEIIIFDEISMIYDLSLDFLWKLTHDLQDVVRKIHDHFKKSKEYNKETQKNRFYSGFQKVLHKTNLNYFNVLSDINGLDLMFHLADFFFQMKPEKFEVDFKSFTGALRRKETYDNMASTINKRKIEKEDISEEQIRNYLENLCLRIVYDLFSKQFQKMELQVPYQMRLFYDIMRNCNNNYKFISNMKEIDSIKPVKFLFVGDYLQIQPFKDAKYDERFRPKKIAKYYLETKSINETISLYKDINSSFSDVFADSNKIEKFTLTICQRQTEEESDFRKLISDMRLGMPMSERSRELLESEGKIINYTVDDLLEEYIDDKNNFTVLSMCNSYANQINNSLILRDYTEDIDLIPNTLLVKNLIDYDIRKEAIYLNDIFSLNHYTRNIEDKIHQLCYVSHFLKSGSGRRSFHINIDKTQLDFLEYFRDILQKSIIKFFNSTGNASYIYGNLNKLCKMIVYRTEISSSDKKNVRYKYNISKDSLNKVRLIISLDKKHSVQTSRNGLNDFRSDIEEEIENILSMNSSLNLESACKKFLDDIKEDTPYFRNVTLHKLTLKLNHYDGKKVREQPLTSEIALPISEDQIITIREIPVKKAIQNKFGKNEYSNINIFVKDMKCMVTKNKKAYGSVAEFKYVNGSMGNFDAIDKSGKLYLDLDDQELPVNISPEIEHQSGNFFCLRFPIVPAYSFSTNKSQGLTITDKVILNLNQKNGGMWRFSDYSKDWFFNLVVAISRCTKLENLIINRYIDENPRNINNLSLSEFIDFMFHDMYNKADRKSKLIFDIEKNKERHQEVLTEIFNRRRKFKN